MRTQHIASTGMALLFAGLAPAIVMAALWRTAEIAPFIFTFTFVIALGHAVLLGLPLFLVFRSMSWINLTTSVVFGFAVGGAPVGVLTWPMQHPELHASGSVVGVLMIVNEAITAIGWASYIKPLIYFGSFGALGGFAFWVALIWCGTFKSDFYNASITRFPRTKDGGFGAAFSGASYCRTVECCRSSKLGPDQCCTWARIWAPIDVNRASANEYQSLN